MKQVSKNLVFLPIPIGAVIAYNRDMAHNLVTWYDDISTQIVEVTEELYHEALNVMPPVLATGCFGVGEPHSHDAHGYPIRHWFAQIDGKYYGFLGIKADAVTAFSLFRHSDKSRFQLLSENYHEYNKGLGSMGGPL